MREPKNDSGPEGRNYESVAYEARKFCFGIGQVWQAGTKAMRPLSLEAAHEKDGVINSCL